MVPRAELAQRLVLGVAAAALIVWLAVSIADKQALADSQKAAVVVFKRGSSEAGRRSGIRKAIADTRSAENLRPGDHAGLVGRVYVYVYGGRFRKALREAERLIRVEPSNRIGWLAIARLTRATNPRRAARAEARLRELVRDPSHPGGR